MTVTLSFFSRLSFKRRVDIYRKMPIFELSSEEVLLLQTCVALVLGGVFQDNVKARKISDLLQNKSRELEAVYSKLENPRRTKGSK
jgi:hypothetical protein